MQSSIYRQSFCAGICQSSQYSFLDLQEKRLAQEIASLEKDTGYKLRVLAQNYPDTPGIKSVKPCSSILLSCDAKNDCPFHFSLGLAIRDFWSVDDNTIVFVADPTFGNV